MAAVRLCRSSNTCAAVNCATLVECLRKVNVMNFYVAVWCMLLNIGSKYAVSLSGAPFNVDYSSLSIVFCRLF